MFAGLVGHYKPKINDSVALRRVADGFKGKYATHRPVEYAIDKTGLLFVISGLLFQCLLCLFQGGIIGEGHQYTGIYPRALHVEPDIKTVHIVVNIEPLGLTRQVRVVIPVEKTRFAVADKPLGGGCTGDGVGHLAHQRGHHTVDGFEPKIDDLTRFIGDWTKNEDAGLGMVDDRLQVLSSLYCCFTGIVGLGNVGRGQHQVRILPGDGYLEPARQIRVFTVVFGPTRLPVGQGLAA